MNLTPVDVEQKAFTQALRGYQMDEVDDFLDEVVGTLRSYDQRLRDAQDKIKVLESEASSRGGDETAISRAILTAQRSADALLEEAETEAERIRSRAMAEADELQASRDAERAKLLDEIGGMRAMMGKLRERLSELATAVGHSVTEMDYELENAQSELRAAKPAPSQPARASPTPDKPATMFPNDGRSQDDGLFGRREKSEPESAPEPEPAQADTVESEAGEVASRVAARPWERG